MNLDRELDEQLIFVGCKINQNIRLEKFSKQQLSALFSYLANSPSIGHGMTQFVDYINQGKLQVTKGRNNFSTQLDEVKMLIDKSKIESVDKSMLITFISELRRASRDSKALYVAALGFIKANEKNRKVK